VSELPRETVVVAGNGMVGHKVVETLLERDLERRYRIVVFGEERRLAYDRVGLSSCFSGVSADELSLVAPGAYADVDVRLGDPIVAVDRDAQRVVAASGDAVHYDALVLATGSSPFVPPIPGNDLPGCFVYRTLDDLEEIRDAAVGARVGAVVGGGLLGLEAARALHALGLETHVVEFAPRLMPVQLDADGGAVLRDHIEALGVHVHTATSTSGFDAAPDGRVCAMRFGDDVDPLPVDVVVFSAGIRPRDELARGCDLAVGERGGILVDAACRTSDPTIYAVGECAVALDRVWGLVAPGYDMAGVVVDRLLDGDAEFTGADLSTKLKLLGVDVASFGDAHGHGPDTQSITYRDPITRVYQRLVLNADGTRIVGGMLVGDASAYHTLVQMSRGDLPTPAEPQCLIGPRVDGAPPTAMGIDALADTAAVCSCNHVTKATICAAITEQGITEVGGIKRTTRAGTTCGGCVPLLTQLLKHELTDAGIEIDESLCEHFDQSRQQLYDLVRVHRITTFSDLLARYGRGQGCEICKPAVASMLASLGNGYVLDGEQASLQDTNDHFLANLQRDGSYSVVPRLPGGEVTPEQLVVIGTVAREFGLYTKITGGQRIDLFGARIEQLPAIWARLIDAGLESGHAYGKALRTVKSCVGQTWCRYGVQDSTAMAVELELRYRGLRAPHKLKSAVSGCVRECAEARSKDFGVIATERGWNLYVGGNGGARPRHADLLAEDLDATALVRLIDRFLMFYIRTADRLERTSTWLEKLDGGIEHLRRVVIDDCLGIGEELEADMARHVATYECEWKATLADPARRRRFRTFVNDERPDPSIVRVPERGQVRPARADEKRIPVEVGW
jgi:nitrite reductase (NADH) large subunit